MPQPGCSLAEVLVKRVVQGTEQQPVLVVDNFFENPDMLIADAEMLSFRPIGPHYPGIRAEVHSAMLGRFLGGVEALIAETFGIARPFTDVECAYSLVTTPPSSLTPIQRLPHFDNTDPGRIAVLHYLTCGEEGGTSFYRHRSTGFETVTLDRLAPYSTALEADVAAHGPIAPAYIGGDTPIFERIAHYEVQFNRAIIYRGHTLHCADIPDGMALPTDPATGRLTVNTFINGRS